VGFLKGDPTYITSLRIQREWVDLARFFHLSLQDACVKGIKQVCEEKISELSEQQIAFITQHHRNRIEKHQEEIMHLERVSFDVKVREQIRNRKKKDVREWDGQKVPVVFDT
jgi:hypothetical protein